MESTVSPLIKVKLSDILPYDGAPVGPYIRAVEALSTSLTRHNAAVIELGSDDVALLRCSLEAVRMYFRTRPGTPRGRRVYMYRAGRPIKDMDSSPPCMADVFRCLGRAARAALSAISRHLRLRSDVFNHLLDDNPLPPNEVSSSALVATFSPTSLQGGKSATGGGKVTQNGEVEKGLLTLVLTDAPGLQVCDPNGHWYLADGGLAPSDLLLLTGKVLSHVTAGLRPATPYTAALNNVTGTSPSGRTSLAFRLMPQSNAILDCSPVAVAGHVVSQSYVPISVSQFLDELSTEDEIICANDDNVYAAKCSMTKEPSLRSVLSDPVSLHSSQTDFEIGGAFLEDAMFFPCGHSFGGLMLRRVIEMSRCTLCNADTGNGALIPNHALRAAAAAVKHEDDQRLFHNAALRKRRKVGEESHRENGVDPNDTGQIRGFQYPFSVNEKVVIKGNRRTPDKLVGKEAVITSQSLNGWYSLQIADGGENVRLQYRSLRKISTSHDRDEHLHQVQNDK
ncbi:hypothetical protein LIER_16485 [Lithospermum erythrorhizon]|uniref:PUB 62/63 C-terminal domain-containing protein n=1 Tax=Lithospermum erythrorhizon TaxID=34254 RepID=A0AAV3Q9D1_LITER